LRRRLGRLYRSRGRRGAHGSQPGLAAKATLTLAAPFREQFRSIKLVVPLKKSLAEKRKAMEAALKAYEQAADYQVAEVTTAATFESAELYRQLGKDLMSSERPKNLSKDELEQYDVLLEEQAFPFEEKAIKLHEVNAARTKDGTDDEWVQRASRRWRNSIQAVTARWKSVSSRSNRLPARPWRQARPRPWRQCTAAPIGARHGRTCGARHGRACGRGHLRRQRGPVEAAPIPSARLSNTHRLCSS